MAGRVVRLRTTAPMKYEGRWLKVGDIFEATEEEAQELTCKVIDRAERLPDDQQPEPKQRYKRRDLRAEE